MASILSARMESLLFNYSFDKIKIKGKSKCPRNSNDILATN